MCGNVEDIEVDPNKHRTRVIHIRAGVTVVDPQYFKGRKPCRHVLEEYERLG